MIKKILVLLPLLSLMIFSSVNAYDKLDCSSDDVFKSNSCNSCFDGGLKTQGDYMGVLKDDWVNNTNSKRILYKEGQKMPSMISLDSKNVTWTQKPNSDGFWEYTNEFDKLYSDNEEGYILDAGKKVTWLKSKVAYAYKLEKNDVAKDGNIGLLLYPISTHTILSDGMPSIDDDKHNTCVLFKSNSVPVTDTTSPATTESPKKTTATTSSNTPTPKKLPDTGPVQYVLLFILSLLITFGLWMFARFSKNRITVKK